MRDVAAERGVEFGFDLDLQLIEIFRNVSAGHTGCQLANVADAALRQPRPIDEAHLNAIRTYLHVVFGNGCFRPGRFLAGWTARRSPRTMISSRMTSMTISVMMTMTIETTAMSTI
jgi:hypothetical protein